MNDPFRQYMLDLFKHGVYGKVPKFLSECYLGIYTLTYTWPVLKHLCSEVPFFQDVFF